jgi:bifunctional UDP-N-acetylglucosamine pyrophosphorylase / glucosamine-1-phosphate N-acetyltransferase
MIAIILAAGKGTRMKSRLPKALHPICGKPMTRYIVDACKESGADDCIVVIGHGAEQVREGLGADVRYALQEEQLGTGHACKQALALLNDAEGDVLVCPGDTPLITADVLKQLSDEHISSDAAATMLTTVLADAGNYGRVIRAADGSVEGIVEAKDATPEQKKIGEINTAIYCFKLPLLRKYLDRITPANAQGEYYLTDVIGLMVGDGLMVGAVVSEDSDIVEGVNDRRQLAYLAGIIRTRILDKLMLDGVSVVDPSSTYIDSDVRIGKDTTVYPGSVIEKGTTIGEECTIGPNTRLVNVRIGSGVSVLYSNLVDSTIGDGTKIGPFANIRPGCRIGKDVKVGDFVEAKNAVIGDGVSMAHLSYVGDAEVGERTNIGAGTITCNYDGFAKHRTTIGKNVFVGSNVTIVAPVKIGDGALVAAGSVLTQDVPGDALAIARSQQTIKEDWARQRREKKAQEKR